MDSQSRFEQWVSTQSVVTKYGAKLHKGVTGRYKDLRIEQRFAAWNAALAQPPASQPVVNQSLATDEREAFEQYFRPKGFTFKRDSLGEYRSGYGAELWAGWQARAALAQQAAPEGWKLMPYFATTEMALRGIEATPSKQTLTPNEWEEYELMSPLQQSLFRACKLWNTMFNAAPPPPGSKG